MGSTAYHFFVSFQPLVHPLSLTDKKNMASCYFNIRSGTWPYVLKQKPHIQVELTPISAYCAVRQYVVKV